MAIVHFVKCKRTQTIGGLNGVINYCCKEEKVKYQDRQLISGINCVPQAALLEFMNTKRFHDNTGGRMYYHMVQSFHPDDPVTPEMAHEIALKLTGLEIDSGKSGVKPDLSMYLRSSDVQRSRFLRYKYIAADDDKGCRPGQATKKKRLDAYFSSIDWGKVDSNIERLPYLAYKLRELTPKNPPAPADPSLLYTFAVPGWKENLDAAVSAKVKALAKDYDHCLRRIRASRQPYQNSKRITDIERILFARGQEDLCDIDSLYAAFSSLTYEEADALYQALEAEKWQFLPPEAREAFLQRYLPGSEFVKHYDLLCDFRNGGYRILGHLVGDCIASYKEKARKELHDPQDSPAITAMLNAYKNKASGADFETVVAQECQKQLANMMEPGQAVKYAVALNLQDFLWDVLYDAILPYVKKQEVKGNA